MPPARRISRIHHPENDILTRFQAGDQGLELVGSVTGSLFISVITRPGTNCASSAKEPGRILIDEDAVNPFVRQLGRYRLNGYAQLILQAFGVFSGVLSPLSESSGRNREFRPVGDGQSSGRLLSVADIAKADRAARLMGRDVRDQSISILDGTVVDRGTNVPCRLSRLIGWTVRRDRIDQDAGLKAVDASYRRRQRLLELDPMEPRITLWSGPIRSL